jgi:hypothetical protein
MKRVAVTLLALLRVLAVVLGLQLSRVGHFATELVEAVASEEVHHESCPPTDPVTTARLAVPSATARTACAPSP